MDHYNTLGVPRDADHDTIKKAYRKLAMQHHPDRGGDPNEFQKITEAYDTLSDADKRLVYDNPQARQQNFPGGFQFNTMNFNLDDIFQQMFGHQRQSATQQVYRTRVSISLVDAYNGNDHILQLTLQTGVKVLNIKIPPGVNNGDQVRYDNILDGGTLIIEFVILPDLRFDRQGNDLYSNLSISVLDLIVGTKKEFTTITGSKVEITINPNTQPSQHIRLRGLGMPLNTNNGDYGDQILLLKPYIPDNMPNDIIESIKRFKLNT